MRLVPFLLLAVLVLGCGSGEQPPAGPGAASSPTASDRADESGKSGTAEKEATQLPPAIEQACAPYAAMVEGIERLEKDRHGDALAVELTAVMKEWAAQVPELERPPGMRAATWRRLRLLAERIIALPDEPSMAQLEAVEKHLSRQELAAIDDANRWFRHRCGLS